MSRVSDAELDKLVRTYRALIKDSKLTPNLKVIFEVSIRCLNELVAMRYKYTSV